MAKRTYVKPELLYESFVLAQHIAACYYHLNSMKPEDCPVDTIGGTDNSDQLFASLWPTCKTSDGEEYCYTPGAGENTFFAS